MQLSPTLVFALTVPAALTRFCSPDAPPPTPAHSPMALLAQAASVGIGASVMAPQFGGQVTIAGRRVVEVLPRADGLVLAEVRDAGGTPMDSGRVLVDVSGIDGRRHPVELRYDTDLRVFEGSADVALAPVPAPVQVTVRAEGEAPTTATMLGVPVAAVPSHGGQVIVVGPLAPEVRVDTNGEVHAYLPSAPSQPPPGTLYAVVNVGQPEPRRVELEYVPEEGHYVAQLGSGVRPVGGDLSLDLEVDGQVHRGRVRQVTLAPPTRLGGSVVVAGDYGLEVANVDGELQATIADSSGAYVSAPPPQIDVYVTGRPAPVVMRWDAPRRVYVAPVPAGVDVHASSLRVEVRAGGRRHRGTVYMRGGPRRAGGSAVVVVDRPSPHVTVEVNAPPPPHIDIRVGHPAPRADVHIHTDNGRHRGHGKHRKVRAHGPGHSRMGGRHR
ncbi:MAG: hypothetical protein KC593_26075 [Myxococcales bacterium]|nr:hypothetical protein [Myxococcales bacterium]MCB9630246.1 hypothetical protein [Sandaracinaceae bacterium]